MPFRSPPLYPVWRGLEASTQRHRQGHNDMNEREAITAARALYTSPVTGEWILDGEESEIMLALVEALEYRIEADA